MQPEDPVPPETICARVIFKGNVQGVGFRYQTCRIAGQFSITGTVKNLSDGTVELIAQGNPNTITTFVKSVYRTMNENISNTNITEIPSQPNLNDFRILH